MKKTKLTLFALIAFLSIISCRGPEGIPGPPGIDGDNFEAAAFEIEVDLFLNASANTYELFGEPFPADITLLPDDVVLIYRLENVVDIDNNSIDIWRQLPQPVFSVEGLLFYNFDFTLNDYSIYLEPEFDALSVNSDFVLNQIFRIVIIPADLGTAKVDESNLNVVLSSLGIDEKNIIKY